MARVSQNRLEKETTGSRSGKEIPLFFGDGLFGFVHAPRATGKSAWLICSPFGIERNHSHRACFELARRFATAGFWAFRFDYRGTGDSFGEFGDFTVDDYLKDIASAVNQLEIISGIQCNGILGLRLGADLAAMFTERTNRIFDLVMWEPVIDGKRYRDSILRAAMANEMVNFTGPKKTRSDYKKDLAAGISISVDGFSFSPNMFNSLGSVDLPALGRPTNGAILVIQTKVGGKATVKPGIAKLIGSFSPIGSADFLSVKALPPWIHSRSFRWQSGGLFEEIPNWISEQATRIAPSLRRAADADIGTVINETVVERPVGFRVGGHKIWGILHDPIERRKNSPNIVMISAGEACRSALFLTTLSRRLAGDGWTVLRFDPRGIGDSSGGQDYDRLFEYFYEVEKGEVVPDTVAALDYLEVEFGVRENILVGLCGGAITSVLTTEYENRVVGIAPMELPIRLTPRPRSGPGFRLSSKIPWVEFLSQYQKLLFLLKLRRPFHLLQSYGRRLRLLAAPLLRSRENPCPGDPRWYKEKIGDDASVEVLTTLRGALDRHTPTCCLFADTEQPRLFEKVHLGPTRGKAIADTSLTWHVVPGADHTFIMPGSAEELSDRLVTWLDDPHRPWNH